MMERGLEISDALGTRFSGVTTLGSLMKLNLLSWWLIPLNHFPNFISSSQRLTCLHNSYSLSLFLFPADVYHILLLWSAPFLELGQNKFHKRGWVTYQLPKEEISHVCVKKGKFLLSHCKKIPWGFFTDNKLWNKCVQYGVESSQITNRGSSCKKCACVEADEISRYYGRGKTSLWPAKNPTEKI
jgi:hypothetical protein